MGIICDICKQQVIVIGKKTICDCGEKEASEGVLEYMNER